MPIDYPVLDESRLQLLQFLENLLPGITALLFIASIIYFIRLVYKLKSESHGTYYGSHTKFGTEEKIGVGLIASTSYLLSGNIIALPAIFGIFWLAYWGITKLILKRAEGFSSSERSVLQQTSPTFKDEQQEVQALKGAKASMQPEEKSVIDEAVEIEEVEEHVQATVGGILAQGALSEQLLKDETNFEKQILTRLNYLDSITTKLQSARTIPELEQQGIQVLLEIVREMTVIFQEIGKEVSLQEKKSGEFIEKSMSTFSEEEQAISNAGVLESYTRSTIENLQKEGKSLIAILSSRKKQKEQAVAQMNDDTILKAEAQKEISALQDIINTATEIQGLIVGTIKELGTTLDSIRNLTKTLNTDFNSLRTQEKSLAEQKGITLKESKEVETATQSASSAIEKREDALTTSILAKQENVIRTIFDSLKKYSPEDAKIWTIIKIILEKDKNVLDNIVALQENIKTAEGQLQTTLTAVENMELIRQTAGLAKNLNKDTGKAVIGILQKTVQLIKLDEQRTTQALQTITTTITHIEKHITTLTGQQEKIQKREENIQQLLVSVQKTITEKTEETARTIKDQMNKNSQQPPLAA